MPDCPNITLRGARENHPSGDVSCASKTATPEALVRGGAAVIELRVRNHVGAMSHITGLFARRAFNLEAIICAPNRDDAGATSRMLLLVAEEPRLTQVERQLARLVDVLEVRHRTDLDRAFFQRAAEFVPPKEAAAVPL